MRYCCALTRQYSNPTVEEQFHDRKSNSVLQEYEAEPRRSEYFESIRSHMESFDTFYAGFVLLISLVHAAEEVGLQVTLCT